MKIEELATLIHDQTGTLDKDTPIENLKELLFRILQLDKMIELSKNQNYSKLKEDNEATFWLAIVILTQTKAQNEYENTDN